MVQPKQLKDTSLKVAADVVRRTQVQAHVIGQTFREIPDSVVSTARIIVSAEERLRQRIRAILRVTVATLFLGISGLISLGANVTMAFAKKVSPETTRVKRTRGNLKAKFELRHSSKNHHEKLSTLKATSLRSTRKQTGMASWYGKQFHNRKTASGVRFNTHTMMAAHRSLPFGTKVRVTNLNNHKSCVVEITDRGPFSHNRIIDLSYAAAEVIGMTQTGTAEVQLEVLGGNGITPNSPTNHDELLQSSRPVYDAIPSLPSHTLASMLNASVAQERDER